MLYMYTLVLAVVGVILMANLCMIFISHRSIIEFSCLFLKEEKD